MGSYSNSKVASQAGGQGGRWTAKIAGLVGGRADKVM